ncbi:unnamed protein product [Discula destructiva]
MEKTKAVYQLDTPFSSAEWPNVSQEDQDSILALLCNLLSPIGQHRKAYIKASKGKRAKRAAKRKRGQEGEPQSDQPMPPSPEVAKFVDVGLSNITRNLQLNARVPPQDDESKENNTGPESRAPYSAIFVSRSGPPSAFFSHLPQMVAVASKAQQLAEPIRLVGFSKGCEERLSACMGIPRVTSVALRVANVGQMKVIDEFVRERVPAMNVCWLETAAKGEYQETNINTIQAPIGKNRQKEKRQKKA